LELEPCEAQYGAGRARRQYDAVEPEHRLVAETIERRWNAALPWVTDLQRRLDELQVAAADRVLPRREDLFQLAADFPKGVGERTTDCVTRKRLVRLLIEEIVARVPDEAVRELVMRWTGGTHTRIVVPKNRIGQHCHRTDRDLIDAVQAPAAQSPAGWSEGLEASHPWTPGANRHSQRVSI
jgi:hypothetical protein